MKRSVTVQIGGQRYNLRSDGDDQGVKEIAAFVDRRLKDVQRQTRVADTQALAVLTGLQIAESLFEERRAHAELKKKIRDKGRSLLHLLERQARA